MRKLAFALSAITVGLMAMASSAGAASSFPYCSWWVKTTPETLNVAFPDSAATYWTTPFYAEEGLSIEVEGTYPNARYMSFNVYNEEGGSFEVGGVPSGLADFEIDPDQGSINPFQAQGEPGGSFTVTLSSEVKKGQSNRLPIAPNGAAGKEGGAPLGFLLYRAYLPTGGNGTVKLPRLTVVKDGVRTSLSQCPKPSGKLAPGEFKTKQATPKAQLKKALKKLHKAVKEGGSSGTAPCRGSECPPAMEFFRATAAATNAFFPNVNNAYVSALFPPIPGKVVVVRGKAATTPAGESPVPWPQNDLQLRYWSLCNNIYRSPWPVVANPESGGGTEYGCKADFETQLSAASEYAYVVGKPGQAAAIERAGGTFIPLSTTQPHARQILIFRNMLPNESFKFAVQDAPQTNSPEETAAAMGAYYPRAYRCTLTQFKAGAAACG
ncbi:MAG: hypothetical protein QOH18_218 [Solirubrobacterales bacterium]|nr:hypothetical protein [Solirubrobacterales bacterium]